MARDRDQPAGDTDLEDEGLEESHEVPPDLLELYEALEASGQIDLPPAVRGGDRGAQNVVPRAAWRARAPRKRGRLRTPKGSTAHYEGPRMGTFPHSSCDAKVRGIQAFHMDQRGWSDIAYTSLVCPHGFIYEGRWWGTRTAANGTNAGNGAHYAHCVLIGQGDAFTVEAQRGLRQVFDLARSEGGAGAERKVHSDWKATACPGDPVRDWVRAGMPAEGGAVLQQAGGGAAAASTTASGSAPASTTATPAGATGTFVPDVPPGPGSFEAAHAMVGVPDAGDAVRHGQALLGVAPDGDFGESTKAAAIAFQRSKGLDADGILGPDTWSHLHPVVGEGDRGDAVAEVQREVGAEPDGVFGPLTKAAVARFQEQKGLTADGIAGPDTYRAMFG